jgi:hypothetical protein
MSAKHAALVANVERLLRLYPSHVDVSELRADLLAATPSNRSWPVFSELRAIVGHALRLRSRGSTSSPVSSLLQGLADSMAWLFAMCFGAMLYAVTLGDLSVDRDAVLVLVLLPIALLAGLIRPVLFGLTTVVVLLAHSGVVMVSSRPSAKGELVVPVILAIAGCLLAGTQTRPTLRWMLLVGVMAGAVLASGSSAAGSVYAGVALIGLVVAFVYPRLVIMLGLAPWGLLILPMLLVNRDQWAAGRDDAAVFVIAILIAIAYVMRSVHRLHRV